MIQAKRKVIDIEEGKNFLREKMVKTVMKDRYCQGYFAKELFRIRIGEDKLTEQTKRDRVSHWIKAHGFQSAEEVMEFCKEWEIPPQYRTDERR